MAALFAPPIGENQWFVRGENALVVLSSLIGGITMTARVEELARQIASLEETDLQALLARIEEFSFRHGINALSDRYRKRLEDEGDLDERVEAILLKLKEIRQEISSREYPG
jgi:hypothetical protein